MRVKLIAHMQLEHSVWNELVDIGCEDPSKLDVDDCSDSELIAATCMRGCQTNDDFIKVASESTEVDVKNRVQSAVKLGHFTVAGFTEWLFEIKEVSRALTHQLVRHRTAWFLQQSQRSVDQTQIGGTVPQSMQDNYEAREIVFDAWAIVNQTYKELIKLGIPKEDARFIIPNMKHTSIYMKIDGCNLMHFLKLRLNPHAQWEIRELAGYMYELVKEKAPNLFAEELQEHWW